MSISFNLDTHFHIQKLIGLFKTPEGQEFLHAAWYGYGAEHNSLVPIGDAKLTPEALAALRVNLEHDYPGHEGKSMYSVASRDYQLAQEHAFFYEQSDDKPEYDIAGTRFIPNINKADHYDYTHNSDVHPVEPHFKVGRVMWSVDASSLLLEPRTVVLPESSGTTLIYLGLVEPRSSRLSPVTPGTFSGPE
ncbi:hypothetical protein BDZ89DRAFT_1079247 [Hymenopellis radicata]|nr:hypothetical protein BDZ89DRAFT_1079247 [Hymenopellis radicata]